MKRSATTSAALVVVFSCAAVAAPPPAPPSIYDSIQVSPQTRIAMSNAEKAAYALYEAVLQAAEAKIHATGCDGSTGSYPIEIFANGLLAGDPDRYNSVKVGSPSDSLTLSAEINAILPYRGQQIDIAQSGVGQFAGREIDSFMGTAVFDVTNTLLLQDGNVNVSGNNGRMDAYQGRVIKDFYHGQADDAHIVYDWGKQALQKFGYPVNKYWQRSKSRRDDGVAGRTVFVKDRLVGPTPCRIVIDTDGYNNEDLFWQDGDLVISKQIPSEPVAAFSTY